MEKLIFEKSKPGKIGVSLSRKDVPAADYSVLSENGLMRENAANLPEISENEVARHFIRLSKLNYNIDDGLYPLGSCTMKYNPKINEKTAALDGFVNLHPCSDDAFSQGALRLMYELGECLMEISGMDGVSLQPSAGSQGELTGILMIRAYHKARGDAKRTKIIIPDSAHGTNPASAAIGGFEIVNLKSREDGRVDIDDLKSKANDEVAGLMLTNPNTVGLFEKDVLQIEKIIHGCGGLIYMDGANLNALLGIARPGDMKFDVVHINLHKTFSTPHGGGGPGAGPVCVRENLKPYLPIPQIVKDGDKYRLETDIPTSIGKIHSFYGNFGVLARAYTYIRMLGAKGLRRVSENAIINANYLYALLKDHFDHPFSEHCMHEFILSADRQKKTGVNAKDIAKRLLDYGFHAPTVYFPLIVHEAMLIEPTETETKEAIDAFAAAMIKIADEAREEPELAISAPQNAPLKRLDDAMAARKLNISCC